MAFVYNASESTVVAYLNAKADEWTTSAEDQDIAIKSDHWKIGQGDSSFAVMKVDELILWDRPLTSDQIKAIYDNHDGNCIALLDCLHR